MSRAGRDLSWACRASARACVASLLVLPGCYLAHSRDRAAPTLDGGRPDASGSPDAGTPARDGAVLGAAYWTLERRPARLRIEHELGCTQYEGGEIAVTVATPIASVCEHGGPTEVARDPDGTARVTSWVWVEHRRDAGACLATTDVSERTILLPAHEGTNVAVTDDGASRVEYRASAIDDLPCTRDGAEDSPCVADCECRDGLVCIPQAGDFVECHGGVCGDPCNAGVSGALEAVYAADLECDSRQECARGAGVGRRCEPRTGAACADSSCGAGLACGASPAAGCEWVITLSATSRHACESDASCDVGLRCVEGRDGARSCEVPCFTSEMRCPPMHECRSERWVCEWIGD